MYLFIGEAAIWESRKPRLGPSKFILLTTQLYIKGFPQNERDFLYRSLSAPQLVTADFAPLKGSTRGELAAHFEIVLGPAHEDLKEDRMQDLDRPGSPGRRW